MNSSVAIQPYVLVFCSVFNFAELVHKTSSIYILLQTAACMRNIDELRDAADVYEHSWTIFCPYILYVDLLSSSTS